MTSRYKKASGYKKAGYSAAAALGLFLGAAGISAAATGNSDPAPARSVSQTDEADDSGMNCEDGIDTATGNVCDEGPAAAQADEATEAPDNEAEADEADDSGVNCEDGIDTATGNESDGGQADNESDGGLVDEATEAPDNEAEADEADDSGVNREDGVDTATGNECDGADDGIDHQFEGEEVGENGNGVADADDANEAQDTTEAQQHDD